MKASPLKGAAGPFGRAQSAPSYDVDPAENCVFEELNNLSPEDDWLAKRRTTSEYSSLPQESAEISNHRSSSFVEGGIDVSFDMNSARLSLKQAAWQVMEAEQRVFMASNPAGPAQQVTQDVRIPTKSRRKSVENNLTTESALQNAAAQVTRGRSRRSMSRIENGELADVLASVKAAKEAAQAGSTSGRPGSYVLFEKCKKVSPEKVVVGTMRIPGGKSFSGFLQPREDLVFRPESTERSRKPNSLRSGVLQPTKVELKGDAERISGFPTGSAQMKPHATLPFSSTGRSRAKDRLMRGLSITPEIMNETSDDNGAKLPVMEHHSEKTKKRNSLFSAFKYRARAPQQTL